MHIPLTYQLIIQRLFFLQTSSTMQSIPTNQPRASSSKTKVNTLSLTLLTSTTFSHSFSFTITPTPPTPSPFPDHHSLYLLPYISFLAPCPLHLTSCKQHTSIILFLSSSQTSPPISIILPKFHVKTLTQKSSPDLPSNCKVNLNAPGCVVELSLYGMQVPTTQTFGLVGANNNRLPWSWGFF